MSISSPIPKLYIHSSWLGIINHKNALHDVSDLTNNRNKYFYHIEIKPI